MTRSPRARNLQARDRRSVSCDAPSCCWKKKGTDKEYDILSSSEKKEWKGATCPVCLEHPHDAVLLLCTSHHKGCRPYMCGTDYHHSNCLEHFKEAYAESAPGLPLTSNTELTNKQPCTMELACPLCRGDVKGWTVVEPARHYLNRKKRTCIHDGCSFIGSYKELCKHVTSKHPSAKPREVDPAVADEWKKFECEREREDAISTIRAMNPGAVIMGDYVLELNGGNNRFHSDGNEIDLEERLNFFASLDRTLNERIDLYDSSDDSLGEGFDFLASLFGRGRRISTGDSYRAHRRHRERPRHHYSTDSIDTSDIQHDSVSTQRGQRTGSVRAVGRTSRRHHPMVTRTRTTRGG
ncbi:hypothetical protein PR202_gb08840 [Eleusine coracana subsp. coracana]|uniref:Uncharacterized protein n=1 Tax=Eleusine coracana subsp. coracana TaxID=191504 RepID=A0AAV5EFP7_ELECO|nr:hypothetical protein PR202_gb08840 [Eleusine coracana subsp. coracana]